MNEGKQDIILKELDRIRKKDFTYESGHILGSMCTQLHPIAKQVYMKFLETNLGDPELFPGTKEIEQKLIIFISKLLNAPTNSTGIIVGGGTEGNITSMWLAKKLSKKKEIILPESAHFSFQKIASLMDMKLIPIPLDKNYCMDIDCVEEKISKDTAAVVGIAGSTELGTIDPIPQLSNICQDNEIFLHVDAAFGGFVIPFLKRLGYGVPDFDFKLKGVNTISIDSHKMGYSAIPLGTLIIRDKKLAEKISVESSCVSSKTQTGLMGTRSGGPVAAAYAVTQYMGMDGYEKLINDCMNRTRYTEEKLQKIGLQPIIKPIMNVVGIKLKKPDVVVQELTKYGWKVNKIDRIGCIRLVLMPHITQQIIDDFIIDLEKVCKQTGQL